MSQSDEGVLSTAQTEEEREELSAQAAIDEAVKFANETVQAGDVEGGGEILNKPSLSREERRARNTERARVQRELGLRELERTYPNTIVVPADISIGDVHIASSAKRFLGLADRTIFLLNRYGQRYLGAAEFDHIRSVLDGLVENYITEARQSLEQGRSLVGTARAHIEADGQPWFDPEYTTMNMSMSFGVKTRPGLALVRALLQWDKAIVEFAALDFNGVGEVDQIATLRRRERALFNDVNRMCLRIIGSVSRRRLQAESSKQAEKEDAPSAQAEEAAA